jgi:hypothetical protein
MYVFGNELRDKYSGVLGVFSSHISAFTAMLRLVNNNHKPLSPNLWLCSDEIELNRIKQRDSVNTQEES